MKVGFVGLGRMGEPMAGNLLRAGIPVTVWNRSPGKDEALVDIGAERAASLQDVFERSTTVMLMLLDSDAIDDVLGRGTTAFATRACGKIKYLPVAPLIGEAIHRICEERSVSSLFDASVPVGA